MSRMTYLLGVGLVLITGAFLLTDRLVFPPGVTEWNCQRIQDGMPRQRVEAILGGPPTIWLQGTDETGLAPLDARRTGFWRAGNACAIVLFDKSGRVVGEASLEMRISDEEVLARLENRTILDRLRAWLNW